MSILSCNDASTYVVNETQSMLIFDSYAHEFTTIASFNQYELRDRGYFTLEDLAESLERGVTSRDLNRMLVEDGYQVSKPQRPHIYKATQKARGLCARVRYLNENDTRSGSYQLYWHFSIIYYLGQKEVEEVIAS